MKSEFLTKQNVTSVRFDPAVFDIELARKNMNNAIKSKVIKPKEVSDSFLLNRTELGKNDGSTSRRGPLAHKEMLKKQRPGDEEEARRKMRAHGTKACRVCGITAGLNKCALCLSVAYCGIKCQKIDWKRHKKEECVRKEKRKKKKKNEC